ncbi:MAG: hypothetical protein JXL84_17705 [Deltaproteobacteria bacterium]|nr:hypothetical protein [Deltaproteobacteria bacterium]
MKPGSCKKCLAALGLFVMCSMGIDLPSICALTPEEILRKSDEARGNADGMEWEIAMTSVESGRQP